uniref:Staphylococcal nuclease domain-containing protein 1 n=1 Tax=Parascaris univalens TaxID=6257 RepID=A0A915AJY5_PARUN
MSEQSQAQPQATSFKRGYVKQVLSGDAVVLQGPPIKGPPKEMTVYLSNVVAPRLAKRPTDTEPGRDDEPFAWGSREFLRQKLVGQNVIFRCDYTAASGREHGRIYLGGTSPENAENVTESCVSEGWVEVRPSRVADEYSTKLLELQDAAKAAKKGKWAVDEGQVQEHVRHITWVIENPRALVDLHKQKPISAVIEQVRDGSTVRAFLLPDFHYITLILSGVKAPATRAGPDGRAEDFAEEAKYFVECRILQRDVEVILEGVSNQNLVGSIVHPKGNIAEALLREGFAKCIDWSIALATSGPEPLRAAERIAKEKRVRLWRSYQPSNQLSADKRTFTAKVVEIVMGDALVVQKETGEEMKIWLSSVRPPREENRDTENKVGRQFRPLYDIPYMFEAREFLRKRLIGKKVQVTIDYVQPKSEMFPERCCCTVISAGLNVAEALISKGLAKVVRYRSDDDNRSSQYDALLAAEAKAEKTKKGLFAEKEAGDKGSVLRIQELQGDAQRSKQFLPYLQRSGRSEGVVEFIASGSRMRLYVPKETCLITFLLSGISCPRGARIGPGGRLIGESEPFAEEAAKFTRSKVLQHEVEIEVEGMDKSGSFIGYMFAPSEKGTVNLSVELVENGLASVHFTAERGNYFVQLLAAEQKAKKAKLGIWANWTDEEAAAQAEIAAAAADKTERTVNYRSVVVTDVQRGSLKFAAQDVDDGAKLEQMMKDLREELRANPPVVGAYTPRRGDLCVARFSVDKLWYRARVEGVRGKNAEILYIDFGNREMAEFSSLAALPSGFAAHPAGAREYQLALVQIPSDPDYAQGTDAALEQLLYSTPQLLINVEYRIGGVEFVQAVIEAKDGTKTDVGRTLIADGHALVDHRRETRLAGLVAEYVEAEKKARREHRNIWEYGDFTGNEL